MGRMQGPGAPGARRGAGQVFPADTLVLDRGHQPCEMVTCRCFSHSGPRTLTHSPQKWTPKSTVITLPGQVFPGTERQLRFIRPLAR